MMTWFLLVVALFPQSAPPTLAPDQVEAAISLGMRAKAEAVICTARNWSTSPGDLLYGASFAGPMARIRSLVWEAKSKYLPFDRALITPEVAAKTIVVYAYPGSFDAPGVTHVVLRAGKSMTEPVLQPITVTPTPIEWRNRLGAVFTNQAVFATFDFAAVAALPAGDVTVVFITNDRERTCKLKAVDRARIQ